MNQEIIKVVREARVKADVLLDRLKVNPQYPHAVDELRDVLKDLRDLEKLVEQSGTLDLGKF